MSQRLSRALGGFITVAVATTLLSVAPAQAREAETEAKAGAPRMVLATATAKGPNHFNSSATVDVAAGGTATVTSPGLDNKMKKAKVEFDAPLSADEDLFKSVAFEMFQKPTPGKRLLHCIHLTGKSLAFGAAEAARLGEAQTPADVSDQALAIVLYCLSMARIVASILDDAGIPRSLAGSAACGVLPVQVKTKTEQVNGDYVVSSDGPVTQNAKKAALKVKCARKGDKLVYTVQPRKKGKTLKSVVGKNLKVGIASPATATDGVRVKVTFKAG